jgi:hypothetical protein
MMHATRLLYIHLSKTAWVYLWHIYSVSYICTRDIQKNTMSRSYVGTQYPYILLPPSLSIWMSNKYLKLSMPKQLKPNIPLQNCPIQTSLSISGSNCSGQKLWAHPWLLFSSVSYLTHQKVVLDLPKYCWLLELIFHLDSFNSSHWIPASTLWLFILNTFTQSFMQYFMPNRSQKKGWGL